MSSTLFISDLHLDPARPAITAALARFLTNQRTCSRLYILGDLFEAWIGDDDDSPIAAEVTSILRDFSADGPGLFIMQGNRDFLLGEAFCHAVGAQLLPDPTVIDLYGESTLLLHGDSLCTRDKDYLKFRNMARNPHWQQQLLDRSLAERRELAGELRGMSEEASSNKAQDIMDVTPAEVEKVMGDFGVKQLIHGHTHRPAQHVCATGNRWVLGDWAEKAWVIEASARDLKLINFVI